MARTKILICLTLTLLIAIPALSGASAKSFQGEWVFKENGRKKAVLIFRENSQFVMKNYLNYRKVKGKMQHDESIDKGSYKVYKKSGGQYYLELFFRTHTDLIKGEEVSTNNLNVTMYALLEVSGKTLKRYLSDKKITAKNTSKVKKQGHKKEVFRLAVRN